MDKPLKIWYCDVCGKPIKNVKQGYVIWKITDGIKNKGFKIIHQAKCDLRDHDASKALDEFLGADGLTYLLAHFSRGPIKKNLGQDTSCDVADIDEYVDFIRRVQTPYYEEARRLFGKEDLLNQYSDANEICPYLRKDLKGIILEYSEKTE